jgi:hypothetical protein
MTKEQERRRSFGRNIQFFNFLQTGRQAGRQTGNQARAVKRACKKKLSHFSFLENEKKMVLLFAAV